MAYASIQQIRDEAGFTNNANILSATITDYQTRAYNVIISYVAATYSLATLTGSLFTGSPAETFLKQVEILLAAGYLLQKEYAGQNKGENEGDGKVKAAMDMLKDLKSGMIRLLDINGLQFPSNAPSSLAGQASLTAPAGLNDDPISSERKFSVDTIY